MMLIYYTCCISIALLALYALYRSFFPRRTALVIPVGRVYTGGWSKR